MKSIKKKRFSINIFLHLPLIKIISINLLIHMK